MILHPLYTRKHLQPCRRLDRRHLTRHSGMAQLLLITPAYFGVFVFIFDERPTLANASVRLRVFPLHKYSGRPLEAHGKKLAAITDREMARRQCAGIEMLVEPKIGRAVNTGFLPFYF